MTHSVVTKSRKKAKARKEAARKKKVDGERARVEAFETSKGFFPPLEISHEDGGDDASVGASSSDMFAVLRLRGRQFKVVADDLIVADKFPANVGDDLLVSDILMMGTADKTLVGRPTIPGAQVKLTIEEQTKGKKIIVAKKRSKRVPLKTQGFRREVTLMRVGEMVWPDEHSSSSSQ